MRTLGLRPRLFGVMAVFCLGISCSPAFAACYPRPSGLVAFWPGEGNANDIIGTNHGTLNGGATNASGLVGLAFTFDGTNANVQIQDSPTLEPTNLTVEAWVYFASLTSAPSSAQIGTEYIVFKKNSHSPPNFEGYSLTKLPNNTLIFLVSSVNSTPAAAISTMTVTTNTWYHVAGVRDSNNTNNVRLYVNGTLQGQATAAFSQDYGNTPLCFGMSGQPAYDAKLKGRLDEVSLYNRALSLAEIQGIYLAGAEGKCSAPQIVAQPQSRGIYLGGKVTFAVTATGSPTLSHQWRRSGINLTESTKFSGTASSGLTIKDAQFSDTGNYSVLVSNSVGVVTSQVAALIIAPALPNDYFSNRTAISSLSTFGWNIGAGKEAAEPTHANNIGGHSVWWKWTATSNATVALDTIGSTFDTLLAVYTGNSLTNLVPIVADDDSGGDLASRVRFLASAGVEYQIAVDGFSGAIGDVLLNLTVGVPAAPQIAVQPDSQIAYSGETVTLSVSALDPPLTYQWRKNSTNVSGATQRQLQISNVQLSNGGTYSVFVSNAVGFVLSSNASLAIRPTYSFSTLAGLTGSSGSYDGTGSDAGFLDPVGIAVDSAGTVYVADTDNHSIRKVTAAGIVTTFAGMSGSSGSSNGIGSQARFKNPYDVAVTTGGVVYVADTFNHTIRKISTNASVSTLAGEPGVWGNSNGLGSLAKFNFPIGVALDNGGNIYVADWGNHMVRKVTPGGVVTTVAGLGGSGGYVDGPTNVAQFNQPWGITIDAATNIYVADGGNQVVRKITNTGNVLTLAGSAGNAGHADGTSTNATFNGPRGLAVDGAGNIFVADCGSGFVRQISPTAEVVTIGGGSYHVDGIGPNTSFSSPSDVAIDSLGNIYVADTGHHTVRKGVVGGLPTFLASPEGQVVVAGAEVTFVVLAVGTSPITYQWRKDGLPLAGATNNSYRIPSAALSNSGAYDVSVSNAVGFATSAAAPLTVLTSPANDSREKATLITGSTNMVFGSNRMATGGEYVFDYLISRATNRVWWKWVAQTNGTVIVDTIGSSFDTVLWVLDTNYDTVTADDDSGGNGASRVQFEAIQGQPFYIVVGGWHNDSGDIVINLKTLFLPPAIEYQSMSESHLTGTDVHLSVYASGTQPLNYQWRQNGTNIQGATQTSFDILNAQVTNSGIYSLLASNFVGYTVSTNIVISIYALPPNDDFTNAIPIIGPSSTKTGYNVGAKWEYYGPGLPDGTFYLQDSVWWSWLATNNAPVSIDTFGSSFDTVLAVFSGNSFANLQLVAYNNNDGSNITSRVSFNPIAGATYQIAVGGAQSGFTTGDGDIVLHLTQTPLLSPQITVPPEPRGVLPGGNATFSVSATGTLPLGYQWQRNNVTLPGATNSSLVLTNLAIGQAGDYRVIVTNLLGSTSSIPVQLFVAASPSGIGFRANWPGFETAAANDVQVEGNFAYLATGAGLLILDISDPLNVRRVGTYPTGANAQKIVIRGGYAYILTESIHNGDFDVDGAMHRIDVRNPALAKKVAEFAITNFDNTDPPKIAVGNSKVLIATQNEISLLNTTNLNRIGMIGPTNGNVLGLGMSGDIVFFCRQGSDRLELCDVSDATNVVQVGAYAYNGFSPGPIAISGTMLSVSGQLVDVSHLEQLKHVGSLTLPSANLVLSGNYAYSSETDYSGTGYLTIIDFGNPSTPVIQSVIKWNTHSYSNPNRVAISGTKAYIAAGTAGLVIVDISNASSPSFVNQFFTAVHAQKVILRGNLAYVLDLNAGFHVLDVTVPELPNRLSTYISSDRGMTIAMAGQYLLLGLPEGKLEIVDVANSRQPTKVGQFLIPQKDRSPFGGLGPLITTEIATQNGLAYVAIESPDPDYAAATLCILNVSNPVEPVVLGKFNGANDSSFDSIIADGTHAYLADLYHGLRVLDISNPQNPIQTGFYEKDLWLGNHTYSFALSGNLGYLSGNFDGNYNYLQPTTHILDVQHSNSPSYLGKINDCSGCSFVRTNIALSRGSESIQTFDVGNPSTPILLGEIDGITGSIVTAGRYAFVSGGDQGLTVLDIGAAFTERPSILDQPKARHVVSGDSTNLYVGVTGTVPISYQWRLNGTGIPGATRELLSLTNIQAGDAGEYSVLVSNSSGSATSSVATLTVDQPPIVRIARPYNGQYYFFGTNAQVEIQAADRDTNGLVSEVRLYDSTITNLIAYFTNTFSQTTNFARTLTNLPMGIHDLFATAVDNEGAWATSPPVRITVTNIQVFQLSQAEYQVSESSTGAVVTVVRNAGVPASVTFYTFDNTARAVKPGIVGQYYEISNVLSFADGEFSRDILISNVNDLVYRGDKNYLVLLTQPTNQWQLAYPSTATVTIKDDEMPGTNLFPDVVRPTTSIVGLGSLTVNIGPTAALGKWRLPWDQFWRNSGTTASNLMAGDYPVSFSAVAGYGPLTNEVCTVTNGPNVWAKDLLLIQGGASPGSLGIRILPTAVANATDVALRGQWRLQGGSTNWNDNGAMISGQTGQVYVVEFKPISGFETPPPLHARVISGQTTIYQAAYSTPANGLSVLPDYFTITNDWQLPGYPYAYCGQIFSDAGYGSGFVVKKHTVLTAAHMVYDPITLSYISVDAVWWFLQRQAGEYETPPQRPRGWYVLEGYASARSNSIVAPTGGESSAAETAFKVRDVAALFFASTNTPGKGGYGGFLTSVASNHVWLEEPNQKLLVGYPVQNVPEQNRGKMHRVGPGIAAFAPISDKFQELYETDDMLGYPGMSGGPVCVLSYTSLSNLYLLPAGVYLGASDAGLSQVRIIDLDVVNLINSAEDSAVIAGADHSGGGVTLINGAYGSTVSQSGIVEVSVGPAAAIRLGGAWRVSPTNHGNLRQEYTIYTSNSINVPISGPSIKIEMRPLDGFLTPEDYEIVIAEGAIVPLNLLYSVPPPLLSFQRSNGVGFVGFATTGAVDTVYSIETATNLVNWSFQRRITNKVIFTGTNWVWTPNTNPPSFGNRFYRARWISD